MSDSLGRQLEEARKAAKEDARKEREEAERKVIRAYVESADQVLAVAEKRVRDAIKEGKNYINVYTMTNLDAPHGFEKVQDGPLYRGDVANRVLRWCWDNGLQTDIRLKKTYDSEACGWWESSTSYTGAYIVVFVE